MFTYLVGSCVYLLGVSMALDAVGVPYICGEDASCGTTSMMGGPVQYGGEEECYLRLSTGDPYFDGWLWCQPAEVVVNNGPVHVTTTCEDDPSLLTREETPYALRLWWARLECPVNDEIWDLCDLENVCTAADVINGDCTCTAADEAAELCTP